MNSKTGVSRVRFRQSLSVRQLSSSSAMSVMLRMRPTGIAPPEIGEGMRMPFMLKHHGCFEPFVRIGRAREADFVEHEHECCSECEHGQRDCGMACDTST